MTKTLKDVLPSDFLTSYRDVRAYNYRDVEVVTEHFSDGNVWPGPQKNVHFWVELVNEVAVGWNENPERGWSFPVVSLKKDI
jgi:hypothetical protein